MLCWWCKLLYEWAARSQGFTQKIRWVAATSTRSSIRRCRPATSGRNFGAATLNRSISVWERVCTFDSEVAISKSSFRIPLLQQGGRSSLIE